MREICCVPGCENNILKSHRIPVNVERRKTWLKAMKLENWSPKSSSRVCCLHFTVEDFTTTNKLDEVVNRRCLKPCAVPSIFPWNWRKRKVNSDDSAINIETGKSTSTKAKQFKLKKNETHVEVTDSDEKSLILLVGNDEDLNSQSEESIDDVLNFQCIENNDIAGECIIDSNFDTSHTMSYHNNSDTSFDLNKSINSSSISIDNVNNINKSDNYSCASVSNSQSSFSGIKINFSIEILQHSDKAVHFFTGLETYEKFKFVFSTLGSAVNELEYFYKSKPTINVLNQFFLTLIILRQHKTHTELSLFFNISEKQVANIFITWIKFMSLQWQEICQWPSKELVQFFTPKDLKKKFPHTRLILDATEILVNKPSIPTSQQQSFSTYKNKSTIKTVVGITPGGLTSYISTAYAGSTSDRQIIERSNVIEKCDPGDRIMSDKGFDIQDLLAPYGIVLNLPTFFKKKNQISCQTLIKDQKIASKRVHVERIIGLGKSYVILNGALNNCEIKLSDDIIFVCFMLCNFRRPIIDPNK